MTQKVKVGDDGHILCGWFAMCTEPAAGVVTHPVLEYVPCCARCAGRFDMELIPAELELAR